MNAAPQCPSWCVDHRNSPELDEGWVWHHGRPIEWTPVRGTCLSVALAVTTSSPGSNDDGEKVYIELGGNDRSGFGVSAEIDLRDVQTVIDALRELVGVAKRAV